MKKLVFAAVLGLATLAQAEVTWSWWMNKQDATPTTSLGIASKCASVKAAEVSLLYNGSPVKYGAQVALILNQSDATCAAQAAFVNIGTKPKVQVGFVNVTDDSLVQVGLLNFNKEGFLPVFPFVNLAKRLFD